jgi:hypothetical protein
LDIKRKKVIKGRKKLHNEDFHDFFFSLNIIGVIKSRRMRWAGCMACMQRNA